MNRDYKFAAIAWVLIAAGALQSQNTPAQRDRQRSERYGREIWQAQGRLLPNANAADLRRKAIQQKINLRSIQTAPSNGSWLSLGPLPLPSDASGIGVQDYGWVSGRVTAVAIDPNDPSGNTVFVGGAHGGVWKSSNAGSLSLAPDSTVWKPVTDDQATLAIGAIAVQPQLSNPDPRRSVILAGTGEAASSQDSYYGLGILRSADGGTTWTLISQDATGAHSFAGLGFSRIAFSAADSNLVVAAVASSPQGILQGLETPLATDRGIYYSTDAGLTWRQATITDAGSSVAGASATSVAFNAALGKFFAAVRFHGFYSSPDGANWSRLAAQPGTGLASCPAQATQPSACAIYRGEIAVVPGRAGPTSQGEMYVWYVDSNDADRGIWVTSNGGASWTAMNESGIANCGDLFGGCGTEQGSRNLSLAAVPNGNLTDLYAGATNIFKCTITATYPTCNGTGPNAFRNLTHVYGCSDISRVHHGQHSTDFVVTNGTSLMYFANDGGMYRALDGFTGLTTGACGSSNQFDNLNASLGPLTQVVSFSQSADDPNILLAGSQENGAPATASLMSGGPWANISAGDIGTTAINPSTEDEWLLATPPDALSGINVFRCSNGPNCHTQDVQGDQVVSSSSVGGDAAGFYPPFLFDPANSSNLLVGTCRVWSGLTGNAYSPISPNFEIGGSNMCSGGETNMVRTIAAGGPNGAFGNSQVIYAGTDGYGPLVSGLAIGGKVWVTTGVDNGAASWRDRTSTINPFAFPISSIVIDPADRTGQTAYVAIMGFHTSHVWRTNNAGAWWTDFTGNLPDAPANALAIDSSNSTVYVGTDVGVFASSTAAPNWSEVGPAAGQPGYLPNVAVTSLKIFNAGGTKRLRAATYGRGIWEWDLVTTPDFQIDLQGSPATIFARQQSIFNGVIFARNGYSSSVTLGCIAQSTAAPATCTVAPATPLPTSAGTAFTMTVADSTGDYAFSLQGVGTDAASVTHSVPVLLHVVDFSLGTPSPSAITVVAGSSSSPLAVSLSAAGSFSGTVTLACSGLPAGASCQFQPPAAHPTATSPAAVSLWINVSSGTSPGTAQVTIDAATPGGPARTQNLQLTIVAAPDYSLAISNSSLSAQVNSSATFAGTVTALNGYADPVAIRCGTGAPPSCTVAPSSLTPSTAGTTFTVTVSSAVAQTYSFHLNALGSDASAVAHSIPLMFLSLPNPAFDFSMSATPSSVSVSPGQSAVFTIDLDPGSQTFPAKTNLSCSGLPTLSSCGFNPPQVNAGSGDSAVSMTISTTQPTRAVAVSSVLPLPLLSLLLAPLLRKNWRRKLQLLFTVSLLLFFASCGGGLQGGDGGGGGTPGTKPGTYTVTVTATCGSVTHNTVVMLVVTQ